MEFTITSAPYFTNCFEFFVSGHLRRLEHVRGESHLQGLEDVGSSRVLLPKLCLDLGPVEEPRRRLLIVQCILNVLKGFLQLMPSQVYAGPRIEHRSQRSHDVDGPIGETPAPRRA